MKFRIWNLEFGIWNAYAGSRDSAHAFHVFGPEFQILNSKFHILVSFDTNLRLEDAAVAAGGALARLRQLVFVERKPARPAPRRHDDDAVAGGAGGADHVAKRVLDIGARKPKLPREARHRSRFRGERLEQLLAKRHSADDTTINLEPAEPAEPVESRDSLWVPRVLRAPRILRSPSSCHHRACMPNRINRPCRIDAGRSSAVPKVCTFVSTTPVLSAL